MEERSCTEDGGALSLGDFAWQPIHVSHGTGSQETPKPLTPAETPQSMAKGLYRWTAVGQCSPASRQTLPRARVMKSNCVTILGGFSNLLSECGVLSWDFLLFSFLGIFGAYAFVFWGPF